jgi:N-carbamoylputrescine amidase
MRSPLGDLQENLSRACGLVDSVAADSDLILLPELFAVGPFPSRGNGESLPQAEALSGPTVSTLQASAGRNRVAIAVPFFEEAAPGMRFNSVCVLDIDGEVLGVYRKSHLASRRSREKHCFQAGARWTVFTFRDWHIGLLFGSELFHPEAARALAIQGAELLLVPAALPPQPIWAELLATRAFENGCYVAVANQAADGREANGAAIGGETLIAAPLDGVLAELERQEEAILTRQIHMEEVHRARNQRFMLRDRRPDVYRPIMEPGARRKRM